MRLANRKAVSRLQSAMAHVLRGAPLDQWADDTAARLLAEAGQTRPPADLFADGLLRARNISRVKYTPGLPAWGRLGIQETGFLVELALTRDPSGFWPRFAMAHELAHTLLYDCSSWPPAPVAHLPPGNPDLEWFCTYLGKCLVLPARWLVEHTRPHARPGSDEFSLQVLGTVSRAFQTPRQIAAERLVEDLGLWRCVMLEFTLREEKSSHAKHWTPVWRLTWHTAPSDVTPPLFIPVGRRGPQGAMKYPRAKGSMPALLERFRNRGLRGTPVFKDVIESRVLSVPTLGNLGTFLRAEVNAAIVPVHVSVDSPPEQLSYTAPDHLRVDSRVSVCFILPGSSRQ
jgi:hypothetical protein